MFETERLDVRHLDEGDVDALLAVYGDALAMRWVEDGGTLDRATCREWVAVTERNYATRGYGMSAVVCKGSGEVVGFCGLVHPGDQAEPEIKYAFRRDHWGQGLATEVVRGMLEYGRAALQLASCIATVHPENTASQRVLAKAGMVRAETRRNDDGSSTCVLRWAPTRARRDGSDRDAQDA